MAELTFIHFFSLSCGACGGGPDRMVAHKTHCHRVAVRTLRIFHLLGLERISLNRATAVAHPHIVVNRLDFLFKILSRSKISIILLFFQFVHIAAAIRAFHLFVALPVAFPFSNQGRNQRHSKRTHSKCPVCRPMPLPHPGRMITIHFTRLEIIPRKQSHRKKEQSQNQIPHKLPYHI